MSCKIAKLQENESKTEIYLKNKITFENLCKKKAKTAKLFKKIKQTLLMNRKLEQLLQNLPIKLTARLRKNCSKVCKIIRTENSSRRTESKTKIAN